MAENSEGRTQRVVLAVTARTLGRANEELGSTLTIGFLRALAFRDDVPETVVCYNEGVLLAAEGSPAVPMLQALAEKGADVVLCGTCLNFFNLAGRTAVGRVGDMHGIVETLMQADKVLYL